MPKSRILPSGYDSIGPFHPFVVFAGVLLLDLIGAAAIIMVLLWSGDKAEDQIAPGGEEWIQL